MARKPVHLTAANGKAKRPGRQGVWEAIRALGEFSVADLEHYTRTKAATIRTYVMGLERAGYLERIGRQGTDAKFSRTNQFQGLVYRLVRDIGIEAPRVTRNGEPVTQGNAREQMWRTAKILSEFDARDLAIHASTERHPVDLEDARSYTRYLEKAGYLAVIHRGGPGRFVRYRFLATRNTGPEAPQIQRVKRVWDPNLEEVVWPRDGEQ